MAQQEAKSVNDGIANSKDDVQVLKGIQPRHQMCYTIFKFCRLTAILFGVIDIALFILTFVPTFSIFTSFKLYRYAIVFLLLVVLALIVVAILDKLLFLRKAPFDDWVFEIAEKRLGTSIIFYDSKYIYINYDRSGKEVDKREFVTEMSDKSVHFSYYYITTDIDQGYIKVECKKRQPIPDKASFSAKDDTYWNIFPLGLTINGNTQKISPIGWYINDQNINDELYTTIPSTSILIAGGTGCLDKNTPVMMYNTLVH